MKLIWESHYFWDVMTIKDLSLPIMGHHLRLLYYLTANTIITEGDKAENLIPYHSPLNGNGRRLNEIFILFPHFELYVNCDSYLVQEPTDLVCVVAKFFIFYFC